MAGLAALADTYPTDQLHIIGSADAACLGDDERTSVGLCLDSDESPNLVQELGIAVTSIHWRPMSEEEASATHLMMQVVSFAETIRLVPRAAGAGASVETLNEALRELALLGIARHVQPVSLPPTPAAVARVSDGVIAALQDSPLPQAEWPAIAEILGDDALAALVNVSASSLNRYRSGERTTPDAVAARLHFVALVVSDLAGSYNDFGIRRWFQRPRSALGGSAPGELLAGDWNPDGREATQVRALARALLGASIG